MIVKNRIRELREARGLTQEDLGEKVGRTKHQILRLENGSVKLDLETADKVAVALGVTLAELVGLESMKNGTTSAPGFADKATPYQPQPDDGLGGLVGDNRYLFTIESDALENMGIKRGDVVLVSDAAVDVEAVRPLQAVLVNWRSRSSPVRSVLLPRQFVPPNLAITNARSNEPTLTLDGDAHIFAVCVSVHRKLG